MGVFKWLRRERVTVTSRRTISPSPTGHEETKSQSSTNIGTIRTEEYKRDLAEFQARRSLGAIDPQETPVKKMCGRHSLPVSCTACTTDLDKSFNYEKRSANKYKKKAHRKDRGSASEEKMHEGLPNIQFLFQNQVFMPGNVYHPRSYTEPPKDRRRYRPRMESPKRMEFLERRHIDFGQDEEKIVSPPLFFKNNSLPYDVKEFLGNKSDSDELDGGQADKDGKDTSNSSGGQKNDSCDDAKLVEVMSELKHLDQWADEQLKAQSFSSRSDESKSDTSAYGLPVVTISDLDVTIDKEKAWSHGKWGVVPVQVRKLAGVKLDDVRKNKNIEINILRKCRHPNIILLMGIYPDINNDINIICEKCVDSLYGLLHIQGQILSVQTALQYASDVANALVFLRMRGYVHTELTSHTIMVTARDAAKLADFGTGAKLTAVRNDGGKRSFEQYVSRPDYVNISDSRVSTTGLDCEPLLSNNGSEIYLLRNSVAKDYNKYKNSDKYRWHAPELFVPNEENKVYPCSKSDLYSLSLILWECCNAAMPWRSLTYDKLKELYFFWQTGIRLPTDGTYPGCLLELLQEGLRLERDKRPELDVFAENLRLTKMKLDQMEYIVIPARLSRKKSGFSSVAWDTNSPTDSECLSPVKNREHKVDVHKSDCSTDSEKDVTKSDSSPHYETINCEKPMFDQKKVFTSDETDNKLYERLAERDYSSTCSTPIAVKARIKDLGTPGALHRSDSTEYCSIFSPDRKYYEDYSKGSAEKPSTKLSRSFTPKSYTPLHIKVPECNLDYIRSLPKEQTDSARSSYNFDIKNYSLPTTPIARSNKLRKNAWLSGEFNLLDQKEKKDVSKTSTEASYTEVKKKVQSAPGTPVVPNTPETKELEHTSPKSCSAELPTERQSTKSCSPYNNSARRDSFPGLARTDIQQDASPTSDIRERTHSWSFKSTIDRTPPPHKKLEEDAFAHVNVKPLVAIHERWIYEANKKSGRSMSLPEDNRSQVSAVKPASHCVDTLQKSLPQLNVKRSLNKFYKHNVLSPTTNGGLSEQFLQARDNIAKNMVFNKDPTKHEFKNREVEKGTITDGVIQKSVPKIDQATDTESIEDFIKELIRKEFQHLLHEISDNSTSDRNLDIDKGVTNVIDALKNDDRDKKETVRSFSRVKISGNNKPLLQITFSHSGENSLHVLDDCVNVTICGNSTDKLNLSAEDGNANPEENNTHSLKRCQAFSAIQEARSTEDLYIDDDLSTQMQENFGGKVKLIPLHGSLHEILCEKEDECCLIKVKQENGCDTIYFRCDNSDTESKDAVDGHCNGQDAVVYKRSISLVEERIQRIFPKDKRNGTPTLARKTLRHNVNPKKTRPKSEIFLKPKTHPEPITKSLSSPSLHNQDDEVEVNIENVMFYQDSSSDECLKCQADSDEFEMLEKEIEEDISFNSSSLNCKCLEKISEENLSDISELESPLEGKAAD